MYTKHNMYVTNSKNMYSTLIIYVHKQEHFNVINLNKRGTLVGIKCPRSLPFIILAHSENFSLFICMYMYIRTIDSSNI